MTLEQFFDYKEKAFDAFCKALIRNESIHQSEPHVALCCQKLLIRVRQKIQGQTEKE